MKSGVEDMHFSVNRYVRNRSIRLYEIVLEL